MKIHCQLMIHLYISKRLSLAKKPWKCFGGLWSNLVSRIEFLNCLSEVNLTERMSTRKVDNFAQVEEIQYLKIIALDEKSLKSLCLLH